MATKEKIMTVKELRDLTEKFEKLLNIPNIKNALDPFCKLKYPYLKKMVKATTQSVATSTQIINSLTELQMVLEIVGSRVDSLIYVSNVMKKKALTRTYGTTLPSVTRDIRRRERADKASLPE